MFQLEKIMRHASVFVASFCILLQLVVGANIYEFNITTGEFKPFNASLIPPNTLSWFDKKVLYVGDGGKDIPVVEMWSPLPTGEIVTTLTAMSDFVDATRDTNNAQTVRMKLTHKGWSDVVTEPVCKNDTQACPQIIVVGTTQVVTRTYDGTAESFEEYFADWQQEKGYSFTDDIIKYAFYDYFVNGSWHGIPLYSDFRTLYFNKTTFDRLGLDYPPPLGNTWGAPYWKYWTWEKMVEVATYISQNYDNTSSTVTPGVRLSGLVGMEMQILPSLFRSYRAPIWDSTKGRCGLNTTGGIAAVKNILQKIYVDTKVGDLKNFFPESDPAFQNWTQQGLLNPIDNPTLCCGDEIPHLFKVPGIYIMMPGIPVGTSYTLPYYDARRLANSSDIGRGFIPGKDTFLGGMGMIMVKQSKNKHLAWSFLKRFVDTANYDYISNIGKIRQSVPPYESVQDLPPWNTQRYEIERLSLKTAVPPLYPFSGGEHGYSVIEARRSFRVLLAEMIYKNLSAEQALDRLCEVINYAFLPGCTAFNYKPMFSKCHPNGTSVVTYEWDKSKPCRDGVDLPAPTNVSCASLPVDSPQSIALFTLNGSLILYIFFAAIGFTAFRTRAIIKRSGFVFSQIIIFGSLLCAISVMVRLAEPSTASCISFPVLLGMGYILVFSSFIIKLWRVYVIFERSKVELPQALSDGVILRYLFAIVLGEALVLVLWLVIDQPGPAEYSYFAQNVGMVRFPTCAFGSVGATVVLVYNAIVLLVAAVVAWKVQNVPSDFNETKATVFAIYSVGFIIIIVVTTTTQLTQPQAFQALTLFGTFIATVTSVVVFTLPKLVAAFRNTQPSPVSTGIKSNSFSINSTSASHPCTNTCPAHCKKSTHPTKIATVN